MMQCQEKSENLAHILGYQIWAVTGGQASMASTITAKDIGTSRGPLQPGRRRGGPEEPEAR